MTSPKLRPMPGSAPDALLDQLEQRLLLLTTAALDDPDDQQERCVDEFAPEFLTFQSTPPG